MSSKRGLLHLVAFVSFFSLLVFTGLAQRHNEESLLSHARLEKEVGGAAGGRKILSAANIPFELSQSPQTSRLRTTMGMSPVASPLASVSLDASTTFLEARTFSTGGNGPSSVAVADLNGDGKPDLAVANACVSGSTCGNAAGSVGVLLGNGDGTFQPAVTGLQQRQLIKPGHRAGCGSSRSCVLSICRQEALSPRAGLGERQTICC
jgi:hypothetical protein